MTTVSSRNVTSSSSVIVMKDRLPTATCLSAKPRQLTTRVALAGTVILNCPSMSVTVPLLELPATTTAAPTTGAPAPSTTFPLSERFCAKALPGHNTSAVAIRMEAATFKKCFNIGPIDKKIKYGVAFLQIYQLGDKEKYKNPSLNINLRSFDKQEAFYRHEQKNDRPDRPL